MPHTFHWPGNTAEPRIVQAIATDMATPGCTLATTPASSVIEIHCYHSDDDPGAWSVDIHIDGELALNQHYDAISDTWG